jgi:oxalate decarboxylase/phosphoglucose isomerase-like protein (cupin superfamily)
MSQIDKVNLISLPRLFDQRGNLSVIEGNNHIPFQIKRVYWIYDVPGGEVRGGHAYKKLNEVIIALSGSFDVVVRDQKERRVVSLNRSYYGLFVPEMIWRSIENFSTNALCLILASERYEESDYIRDQNEFQSLQYPVK